MAGSGFHERVSSPRRRALVAAALVAVFVLLALRVSAGHDLPGDRAVLERLRAGLDGRLDGPARLLDRATRSPALAALAGLLAAGLLVAGRRRDAALTVLSVGGVLVGNPLLKQVVDRPRPALLPPLTEASALAFPSGHASGTAALAVAGGLLAAGTRWSAAVVTAAALLVVATATAQLVLARHHPSDLVAGWCWAGSWVLAVSLVLRRAP